MYLTISCLINPAVPHFMLEFLGIAIDIYINDNFKYQKTSG